MQRVQDVPDCGSSLPLSVLLQPGSLPELLLQPENCKEAQTQTRNAGVCYSGMLRNEIERMMETIADHLG